MRERLALVVSILLVGVAGAAILLYRAIAVSGPPFALADMHARITNVEILPDNESSQRALDRLAGKGRLNLALLPGRPQVIAGQIDYDVAAPRGTDGQLVVFVIDTREGQPLRSVWGSGPPGSNVAQGWDSRYERLPDKYKWLSMLAEQRTEGGYADSGMAIATAPTARGPITFEAVVNSEALAITDPARQLTFVLAYVGDVRGAWATRVALSSG